MVRPEVYRKRNVWFLEMGPKESKIKSTPKTPTRTNCRSGSGTVASGQSMSLKPVQTNNPEPVPVWLHNSMRWKSLYDVYICHSKEEADCTFAMEMLLYLEQQPEKLRCFLPMRDMSVGSPIPSEMCSGLENSHCWVMLLTPHFLSDSWCKYQMHQFLSQAPCSNGRLIPVVIGLTFAQYPSEVKHMYAFKGTLSDNSVFLKVKGAILTYLKEMLTVTSDEISTHSPNSRTSESSQRGNSQMESSVTQESTDDKSIRSSVTQETTSDMSMRCSETQETTSDISMISSVTQEFTCDMTSKSPVTQEKTSEKFLRIPATQDTTNGMYSRSPMTQGTTSEVSLRSLVSENTISDMSFKDSMIGLKTSSMRTSLTTSDMSMSSSVTGQETTSDVSMSNSMTGQETTSDMSKSSSVAALETSCWLRDKYNDLSLSPQLTNTRDVCKDSNCIMTVTKDSFNQETQIDPSGVWPTTKDLHIDCSDLHTSDVQTASRYSHSDCRMVTAGQKDSHPQAASINSDALYSDIYTSVLGQNSATCPQ